MKFLACYQNLLNCNNCEQVFDYLISTLKPSNILWTYFVNWEKVFKNAKKIEIALNILNYLIGKENFDEEFRYLLGKNPEVAEVIPALLVRDGNNTKKFKILVDYKSRKLIYEDYDFTGKKLTTEEIEKYLAFVKATGLKEVIVSRKIKNLVDYMIGVEAGIDSNARKNRGGKAMEAITEAFINDICSRNGFRYLKEADAGKIKSELGYSVEVDRSSRRYDFAIDNRKKLFLIETNFYHDAGSKLKSTAGEYRNLYDILKGKHNFIWLTDGLGWRKTARPLRETFDHTEYLFNLDMLEKGVLEFLLKA